MSRRWDLITLGVIFATAVLVALVWLGVQLWLAVI